MAINVTTVPWSASPVRKPSREMTPESYLAGIPMCIDCGVQCPRRDWKICIDCYETRNLGCFYEEKELELDDEQYRG